MTITLDEVHRAAFEVVRLNKGTLNPTSGGACTYWGPNGTTCLGGAVLNYLDVPLPRANMAVTQAPGMHNRFTPEALTFLAGLQNLADRGNTEIDDRGHPVPLIAARLRWRDAYYRACLARNIHFFPSSEDSRRWRTDDAVQS